MNEQTIPAEKVRELADKYDRDNSANPERLLVQAIADLRALLPVQQPTTGMLGRWAKHDAFGDVVVISDHSFHNGNVWVSYTDNGEPDGASTDYVPLADLTFPHQATRPEDVPAGEAWLVDVSAGEQSLKSVVAIKASDGRWLTLEGATMVTWCSNVRITLICPLTPERPASDLQARYDELEKRWKRLDDLYTARGRVLDDLNDNYAKARERIKALEQTSAPRTVATPEEYDALPVGSQVKMRLRNDIWQKHPDGMWWTAGVCHKLHDVIPRTVLRYGWGDEQTAWRIVHDRQNLQAGEYIIDRDGDTGTVNRAVIGDAVWCEGMASSDLKYAPWIAFVNEEAATPEAIAEAMKARDKEAGE